MKRSPFILVLAAAVCAPVLCPAETADGIKAVVNDKVITYAEVEDYARDAANALRQQYASQPDVFQQKLNGLLNDALDQLVERQLVLHSFETDYKMPESAKDEIVQDRIKEQFGDRVTLMKTLQSRGRGPGQAAHDRAEQEFIRRHERHCLCARDPGQAQGRRQLL
jgi:hypothetical protein